MIVSANGIQKSFVTTEVLRNVTFHIEAKEKMALVGVNGAGKSTLFHILRGAMPPDEGQLYLQKNLRIGYLAQNAEISSATTVQEELLQVFEPVVQLENQLRAMEQQMKENADPSLLDTYARLSHDFEEADGYSYQSRVRGVLKGLGFTEAEYQLPISLLSGGQRSRVALGKILLSKPDLLLLDEPTNHLDIDAISWLEGFLASLPGAALIISHDRYFLDKLCTKTLELERGVTSTYNGNYSYYTQEKAAREKAALREYEAQQAEIRHQEEVIAKLRSFNMEKFIRRAQSREKILDKMEILDKPVSLDASMKLTFTPKILSGEDVLSAEGLCKAFDGKRLFQNLNFTVRRGEKVALLGANGTGKTTLFRIIMGQAAADSGYLRLGVKVYPGYYDQEQETLSPGKTILDEIYDAFPQMTLGQIRSVLGSFLFRGEDVFKLIRDLSGGERARVSLCKIMLSQSNFLLLDEPTNHLDIISREILEDNLHRYEGTLLFISHDRYFINRVADKILVLTPEGIQTYLGNYDFYMEHLTKPEAATEQAASPATANKEDYLQQKQSQSELRRKKTRLRRLEDDIEKAEKGIAEIEGQMLLPEFYSSASAFHDLEEKKTALEAQIEDWMHQWDALSEEIGE